jgi:hypothetical protein
MEERFFFDRGAFVSRAHVSLLEGRHTPNGVTSIKQIVRYPSGAGHVVLGLADLMLTITDASILKASLTR